MLPWVIKNCSGNAITYWINSPVHRLAASRAWEFDLWVSTVLNILVLIFHSELTVKLHNCFASCSLKFLNLKRMNVAFYLVRSVVPVYLILYEHSGFEQYHVCMVVIIIKSHLFSYQGSIFPAFIHLSCPISLVQITNHCTARWS